MAFHARSKRADLIRARKVLHSLSAGDPPSACRSASSLGHQGLVGRSTTPEPMATALCLQGVVAHALAVLAEEGEFPFDLGPIRLCAITKVANARHLVDAAGVLSAEPRGTSSNQSEATAWSDAVEMFAGMPEVDNLGFGRQGLQEGPIVGGGWQERRSTAGRSLPDMSDQLASCAFSVTLPSPACGRGSRVFRIARPWRRGGVKPCRRRPRRQVGLGTAVLAGPAAAP